MVFYMVSCVFELFGSSVDFSYSSFVVFIIVEVCCEKVMLVGVLWLV